MFMQNVLVGVLISFQWANGIPVSKGNPLQKNILAPSKIKSQ